MAKLNKNKCPKTMSGKHMWIKDIWRIATGETSGSIHYDCPYEVNACRACGIIEDRKLSKPIDIEE